jgi:hypothetical protein
MQRRFQLPFLLTALFCLHLSLPRLVNAQTSSVTGLVTDPSGHSISSAAVAVTNRDTGVTRTTTTNGEGFFTVPILPHGNYKLRVNAPGFEPLDHENLRLDDGQVLRIDTRLVLGSTTQTVEVRADTAPALDTETSAQSTVINTKTVVDLPLNGRNPIALLNLVPGVRPTGGFGGLSTSAYGDGRISISGGGPSANNMMVDGVAAENFTSGGPQISLSPDATEEVHIITRDAGAEFGRTGGGVINFISKSGTNEYHGDLWEFDRNRAFNANDFFANRSGQSEAPFTFNQFGATFGGPIIRNKTFIFANWESGRQRTGSYSLLTVPTDLQRQGNFSQTFASNGALLTIYDSLTTQLDPKHPGQYIRTPFAGNIVPAGRLNPVALAVGAYYPEPNAPGNPFTAANNFVGSGSSQINKDLWGVKIDHYFTEARHVSGRYTWDRTGAQGAAYFGSNNIADPDGAPAVYPRNSAVISYSDTLTPNFVVELHTGLNRFGIKRTDRSLGFDATKIGLPASINQQEQFQEFPYFSLSDISPIGQNQGDASGQRDNSWTAGGTATWMKGNHNVKFGTELRIYQWNSVQGTAQFQINVSREFSNGPDPNAAASNSGFGYASLLLGYPSSGTLYRYPYPMYQTRNFGTFIQDDWKVSRRLTLNLGLRWEREGPTTDRYNAISNFDPTAQNTIDGIPLTGSIVFPGSNGLPRGNRDASWNDFGPRVGLAYQVLPKTVIRSSYGIFYLPSSGDFITLGNTGFASQTSYNASNNGGLTPAGSLSNPFPNGIVLPSGSSLGALTGVGTNVAGNLRSLTNGYSQQWSFTVQQQLPGSWTVELGYIGNRGVHLPADQTLNYLTSADLAQGTALQNLVNNPYSPLVSVGTLANPQVTRATLLNQYPQFTGVTALSSWAGSTYHAATVRAQRRFSDGFSLLLSYTFSKLLDDNLGNGENNFSDSGSNTVQNWNNLGAEKAVSTSNQPQRLVISGSYAVPFGKSGNRFYRGIVGGWQINPIVTILSGDVISVTANAPAYGGNRPNVVGDPTLTNPTVAGWLNAAAFVNIPAFTFGNAPRNLPRTYTQPLVNFDVSLFKNTRIKERFNLQFRAEAFNIANTPTFGTPNGNIDSTSFGQITSTRTGTAPRQLQFGLKLFF